MPRVTTSLTEPMWVAISEFAAQNGMESAAEAARVLIAAGLTHTRGDRAFAAAYQQALAELRSMSRAILNETTTRLARVGSR